MRKWQVGPLKSKSQAILSEVVTLRMAGEVAEGLRRGRTQAGKKI